jgi:hypothetical protein
VFGQSDYLRIEKPCDVKINSTTNASEYLFENNGLTPDWTQGKRFLSYVNTLVYPTAETVLYLDTAYVNRGSGVMPQYLLVAGHEKTSEGYIRGRFLINAEDLKASDNTWSWNTSWTRLGFVKGIHAGDALYILWDENVNTTSLTTLDNLALSEPGSVQKIDLGDNTYKNYVFSFRLTASNSTNFLIESEANGWIKIQNGVPVILRGNIAEAISEAANLSMKIIPNPLTVSLSSGHTFEEALTDTISHYDITVAQVSDLRVAYGELNAADFEYIRNSMGTTLQILDLSGATVENNEIPDNALLSCSALTSITIPASVTKIGSGAFKGAGLTSITIPASVAIIEGAALSCPGLSSILVDAANTTYKSIGGVLFSHDETELILYPVGNSATSYTIPSTVATIKQEAFARCVFTSVTIPSSVTDIGAYAFDNCYLLTSVTIPSSVTGIGAGAFGGCGALTAIAVDASNPNYSSEGDVLFNKTKTELIQYPPAKTGTSYTIPPTVTDIGAWAFSVCNGLTSMTIPSTVTDIGEWAFSNCFNLASVTISGGITDIGNSVFYGCSHLTSITIPDGVTGIGESAFCYCTALTEITLPASVASIGESAFFDCTGLTSVHANRATPPGIGGLGGVFTGVPSTCTLYIPAGSATAYNVAPWNAFTVVEASANSDFVVTSGVLTGYNGAGGAVAIPGDMGITTISNLAFRNNTTITSVHIPTSVSLIVEVSIDGPAFWGCTGLTAITVDAANTSYKSEGGVLFNKTQTRLIHYPAQKPGTYYDIPAPATDIVWYAFFQSSLDSLTIPASVTGIENGAFSGSSIRKVTVYWTTPLAIPEPTIIGENGLFDQYLPLTLYVPAGTKAAYQAAPTWHYFGLILEPGETPDLQISESALSFAAAGEAKTFNINANVRWSISSSETWLVTSVTSGADNATGITVTATANGTTASRSANLTVSGRGGVSQVISVTQDAAPDPDPDPSLSVSTTSLSFSAGGEIKSFGITSAGVTWSVSSSASWLTVSPSSGSGDATVTLTAPVNSGASSRTATVTVSGSGVGSRTVSVTQDAIAIVPPTLSVSASSLHFVTGGGTQTATVTSNTSWTESTYASWITVSHSGNVLTVAAEHNTGYARADSVMITAGSLRRTIYVSQDAAQQIIVEPTPPTDSQGSIEVAFEIPLDEQFTVTFTITLPAGFVLDQSATSLVSELLSRYQMSITPTGNNGWLFSITPATSLRSDDGAVYQQLVNIAYTTDPSVTDGKYEVKLQNVNLTLNNSGTVIHQDEIKVPVQVGNANGNIAVDATAVRYYNGLLTVNTPAAERIDVYSISSQLLYKAQKAAGEATFNINHLPKGVLIVRGGSGWTTKIVNNE